MFELGSSVNYIRNKSGTAVEGCGIVRALVIDHTGRRVVAIHDAGQPKGGECFNVDVLAVNPSEDFKGKFRAMVENVQALSAEGNKAAAAAVEKYNALIDKAYNELLGEPLNVSALFGAGVAPAANDEKAEAA